MKRNLKYVFVFLISLLLFSACGGSNTSGESNKGTFIDDIVTEIKYINGDKSGFTNSEGKFHLNWYLSY